MRTTNWCSTVQTATPEPEVTEEAEAETDHSSRPLYNTSHAYPAWLSAKGHIANLTWVLVHQQP